MIIWCREIREFCVVLQFNSSIGNYRKDQPYRKDVTPKLQFQFGSNGAQMKTGFDGRTRVGLTPTSSSCDKDEKLRKIRYGYQLTSVITVTRIYNHTYAVYYVKMCTRVAFFALILLRFFFIAIDLLPVLLDVSKMDCKTKGFIFSYFYVRMLVRKNMQSWERL